MTTVLLVICVLFLGGNYMIMENPTGENPVGENPIGEKPIGENPIGENPIGEKVNENNYQNNYQTQTKMEDRSTSSTSSTTSVSVTSSGDDLHLVFSTDCSPFQTWQSYLLFHRAMTIKQTGKITRIVSGCDAKKGERELLETWHETFIDPMSPSPGRFSVHFTPKFDGTSEDGKSGKTYSFFNKPFGLLHWLENGIGLDSEGALNDEDIIVVLLDPDQLIMDPIVNDFSGKSVQIPSRVEKAWGGRAKIPTKVVHGTPISQHYGLGAQWTEFDLTTITGTGDSPAAKVSNSDASNFYPVGPPYLMTGRDALSIARKWSEFVRPTNKEYPHLLGEMYAFCIASAHLGLRHVLVDSLMVSNVDAWNAEGWGMIEDIGRSDICDVDKYGDKALPNVLHFCQVYRVGEFAFHKVSTKQNASTSRQAPSSATKRHQAPSSILKQ